MDSNSDILIELATREAEIEREIGLERIRINRGYAIAYVLTGILMLVIGATTLYIWWTSTH